MQPYARWKYVLLILAALFGVVYSLPNLFGEDPAVQVTLASGEPLPAAVGEKVDGALARASLAPVASQLEDGKWIVRMPDEAAQLRASEVLQGDLGDRFVVALTQASRSPPALAALGAEPMALGLDLRGGVHFLIEVDIEDVRRKAVENYLTELPRLLRKANIRYSGRRQAGDAVVLEFAEADRLEAARKLIAEENRELSLNVPPGSLLLEARISETEAKRIQDFAVQQNLTTLRNRVNQLGVAEPVVQRQGANRIVVQLPGVQDPAQAKTLLEATATLEYRAVLDDGEVFYQRDSGRPVTLSREIIVGGNQLVDAAPTVDQDGSPAVSVTLDATGAKRMLEFTEKNVGKPMAVLFKEMRYTKRRDAAGQLVTDKREVK